MSDADFSETVKKGSNNMIEGLSQLKEGLHHFSRSLSIWFERHSFFKFIILAPISAVIGKFGIQILSQIYVYFSEPQYQLVGTWKSQFFQPLLASHFGFC